jgi:H+-translocating NAD(P) transhydrogenase subunit alpha
MKIAVVKETRPGERRVALVPDVVSRLVNNGAEVAVESGAGFEAAFADEAYRVAGAQVVNGPKDTLGAAEFVARVNPPNPDEAAMIPQGAAVTSFFVAAQNVEALHVLAERHVTYFSFDLLPRISRAQAMDALSSQATVSGYRAALAAAEHQGKFFPMLMTAAGTVPPAKVLIMGVGVAGLQAIATARRLGAVVRAYDVRAAAKEEAESLGARFVDLGVSAEGAGGYARELTPEELDRQRAALASEVAASDVLITTAAVPGRKAPVLVTTTMIAEMSSGAIVIDIAADSGGNCEPTIAGEEVVVGPARVVGMTNPPSSMPTHSSLLFSRNIEHFVALIGGGKTLSLNWEDEIVMGMGVLREGNPTTPAIGELLRSSAGNGLGSKGAS